jgi:hypothetical protein
MAVTAANKANKVIDDRRIGILQSTRTMRVVASYRTLGQRPVRID